MADNISDTDLPEDEEWKPVPIDTLPKDRNDGLFTLHSKPQADTEQEYIASVLDYVRVKFQVKGLGSPMIDLNRRFGSLNRRFSIPVLGVVRIHVHEQTLVINSHRGNLIVFPADAWSALTADWETSAELVDRACDNALRDIGKVIPEPKVKTATKRSTLR